MIFVLTFVFIFQNWNISTEIQNQDRNKVKFSCDKNV